jgi:hypothetical protein
MSLSLFNTLGELREREYRFICEARKEYGKLADQVNWDAEFPRESPVSYARRCYDEGRRVLRIISGSWDEFLGFLKYDYEFSRWMGGTRTSCYYKRRRGGYSYLFTRNPGLKYREGLRYRRQPHHEKKAENPKAAWRARLKGKHENRPNYRRHEKAGRWNKTWNHRKNRRASKRAIDTGRWDEFTQSVQDIQRVWWD